METKNDHKYSFEKLDVWKECRKLTVKIYTMTASFPDNEKFGVVNQMRRASISICSNIAEGSSRKSAKDQAYFYQLAYSSLMELLNQLIISNDLGFIKDKTLTDTRVNIEMISRMLNALRNKRLNPLNP